MYWEWFSRKGFRQIINRWFVLHLLIGTFVSLGISLSLEECAHTVLFPLASIFIGLSFAWAGSAQTLMQSNEIEQMISYHENGFEPYVYSVQTSILIVMITLIMWGLVGLGLPHNIQLWFGNTYIYWIGKIFLFMLSSLTIQECWSIVSMNQSLLIARKKIRDAKSK